MPKMTDNPSPVNQQDVTPEADKAQKNTAPARNRYADTMNKPHRKLPKPLRIGLTVLILAGLICGGVYVVKKTGQTDTESTIQTAVSSRGYLETYIEGNGYTAAKTRAELGKDIKGKVLTINAHTGDTVKTGQVLMTIDPAETRKELEQAQTALNEAQKSVNEANKTLRRGIGHGPGYIGRRHQHASGALLQLRVH